MSYRSPIIKHVIKTCANAQDEADALYEESARLMSKAKRIQGYEEPKQNEPKLKVVK